MESEQRTENGPGAGPRGPSAPRQFKLRSTRGPEGVVVRACGRLSLGHGASEDLWEPHVRDAHRVSLDLTGVTDMDARGIGLLAALARQARQSGVALSVDGASREVRSLAALAQLDKVVPGAWDNGVAVPLEAGLADEQPIGPACMC